MLQLTIQAKSSAPLEGASPFMSASSAIVIVLHFLSMRFSSDTKANRPGGKRCGSVTSGIATGGISLQVGGRGRREEEGGGGKQKRGTIAAIVD
ncbi:unnamed protein product [Sphagnum tenellum]